MSSTKRGRNNDFCGQNCFKQNERNKGEKQRITVECAQCHKIFKKIKSRTKGLHDFCNSSCNATYQNQHKTNGIRRSKLEQYLEEQIRIHYPDIECEYNQCTAINSEIDFYFPSLKLAIELNGIVHYEPIYGQDKLDKIQKNDNQKSIQCYERDIEFCIIDSSSCKRLTENEKSKYWNIFNAILEPIQHRS